MSTIKSHFWQNLCLDYVAKERRTMHHSQRLGQFEISFLFFLSQSEYRYLTSELLKSFFKKSLQVWHEDVFICYASM